MYKNKNKPNTHKMVTIKKITLGIWLLSFIYFMLNLGDGNSMQIPAALLFGGVTVLAMLAMIGIQLVKLKSK